MWEANKIAYRGNSSYSRAYRGSTLIWEAKPLFEGLTFTAEKAGSTVKYTKSSVSSAEYSYDAVNWTNANGVTITLNNVGDKVYFRGQITGEQVKYRDYAKFEMTGLIAASGNINSMNSNSDVLRYSWCYYNMFEYCTSLTTAPELPATSLTEYCYYAMFNGCTSLTDAPELPATSLIRECYATMFRGCTSLTTAPELPATSLFSWCYDAMFASCTSLNKVTTHIRYWTSSGASNWLYNVSPTGDFYNLGKASIQRGTSGIPEGWIEHKTLD